MSLPQVLRDHIFANGRRVCYLDLEYVHEVIETRKRPDAAHWKVVTQFGVCVWSHRSGTEEKHASWFVLPERQDLITEAMWQAHAEITHLNRDDVLKLGRPLAQVWKDFAAWALECDAVVIMLGDADVLRQTSLGRTAVDEVLQKAIRLKPVLTDFDKFAFNDINSGALRRMITCRDPFWDEGDEHNALYDARCMAYFVDSMCCVQSREIWGVWLGYRQHDSVLL
jgi:hypothetical protein